MCKLHTFPPTARSRPVVQAGGVLPPPGTLPRNLQPQGPHTPGVPHPTPHLFLWLKQLDWCQPGCCCPTHSTLGGGRCVGGSLLCDLRQASFSLWSQRGFLVCLYPHRILQASMQLSRVSRVGTSSRVQEPCHLCVSPHPGPRISQQQTNTSTWLLSPLQPPEAPGSFYTHDKKYSLEAIRNSTWK